MKIKRINNYEIRRGMSSKNMARVDFSEIIIVLEVNLVQSFIGGRENRSP